MIGLGDQNMRVSITGTAVAAVAAGLLLSGTPARAEWKRAESPRFIVYSRGAEGPLRRYVQALETYDYVLRVRMGLPLEGEAVRKLPIYLVESRAGLVQINPGTGENVAGTYFPTGEDIFAAAIQDREQDFLLHEYFHHFSMALGGASTYPGWLIEGLAEYFMTADIKSDSVTIGGYNENRVYWLQSTTWLPLEELLSKRPGEIRRSSYRETYYPLAWLLTHWFMGNADRRTQLTAYLADVTQGGDPVEALQRATNMTLGELRQELRRYLNGRVPLTRYELNLPTAEIAVTRLPRSADDLLLLGQRLKLGVADDKRAETAELVRRLAARYPDDPFAMLQLGHAELHFGDADEGEAILTRLLEREPDNVEALQLMASRYMRLAQDRPDEALTLIRQARSYLAHAYRVDSAQYFTLSMLARTRQGTPDYPTQNDLTTWDLAFNLAPQLASIRLGYASAMMQAEEFPEAIALLEPLANAPHGGEASESAQRLIQRARANQDPLSDAELEAAAADSAQPGEPETDSDPSAAPPSPALPPGGG